MSHRQFVLRFFVHYYPMVNSSTLATSCEELIHWKRLWCWEGLGAGGEGDDRRWDGWMASPTRWKWVWVYSGRRGVLQFMGSQRVGQDWATELIHCHNHHNKQGSLTSFLEEMLETQQVSNVVNLNLDHSDPQYPYPLYYLCQKL